jgi:hypothetical protein
VIVPARATLLRQAPFRKILSQWENPALLLETFPLEAFPLEAFLLEGFPLVKLRLGRFLQTT